MKELVRIANTDIKGNYQLHIGLTKIHGIGYSMANAVCNALNLNKSIKIGELNEQDLSKINELLNNPSSLPSFIFNRRKDYDTGKDMHIFGAALKLRREFDIRAMKKMKSYRGMRHALGQPVRGQRTKSHFRTGSTVGVMKKAAKILAAKSGEEKKDTKKDKK